MGFRALGSFGLLVLAECYHPSAYAPCRLTCTANTMTCPGQTMCSGDSLCHFGQSTCPGIDVDAALPGIDGPVSGIDAPVSGIDAPVSGIDGATTTDAPFPPPADAALCAPGSDVGTLVHYCATGSEQPVQMATETIDVTACTGSGSQIGAQFLKLHTTDGRPVCALVGSTISISGLVSATQEAQDDGIAFALIATSTITISSSGDVDVSSVRDGKSGPGQSAPVYGAGSILDLGPSPLCAAPTALAGATDATDTWSGGAAGGSFGGTGGAGGPSGASGVPAENGGSARSTAVAVLSLRGGCPGGDPSNVGAAPGGGALYLVAATSIDVSGTLQAGGAGGAAGSGTFGGNGGASGGMIVLDAPAVMPESATVSANGGGGGAGGSPENTATGGADSVPGSIASGGVSGNTGGAGGAGSFSTNDGTGGGQGSPNSTGNNGGGAGGGAAGVIEQLGIGAGTCTYVSTPVCKYVQITPEPPT